MTIRKDTPVELERRRRIRVSIWAYAYEIKNDPIVSDAVFDVEAYQINLSVDTGKPYLDFWFRAMFKPYTGMWIHHHPDLNRIAALYERYYKNG